MTWNFLQSISIYVTIVYSVEKQRIISTIPRNIQVTTESKQKLMKKVGSIFFASLIISIDSKQITDQNFALIECQFSIILRHLLALV